MTRRSRMGVIWPRSTASALIGKQKEEGSVLRRTLHDNDLKEPGVAP